MPVAVQWLAAAGALAGAAAAHLVLRRLGRRLPVLLARRASRGGRIATISGSRPTISVSVWWRAWLQRQTVGSRMIMKHAIW